MTTRTKTIVDVYLDVDGVLNAVTRGNPQWGWRDTLRLSAQGFLITYSPQMIERLNALAELEHVRVHWLTTWLHDAYGLAAKLGLNGQDWDVLEDPREDAEQISGNDWWKLHAITKHVAENPGHQIVWIDDDLAYEQKALAFISTLGDDRCLDISPITGEGLTSALMDRVERWVA